MDQEACTLFDNGYVKTLGIVGVLLSLLFGMFVSVMFYDQLRMVMLNTSSKFCSRPHRASDRRNEGRR